MSDSVDYVEQLPDGGWRIVGTRVSLDSIIHAYWDGRQPESIVADFPTLTLERVHGAIAFYLRRRGEIDSYLEQQSNLWRRLRSDSAASNKSLIQRLKDVAAADRPS